MRTRPHCANTTGVCRTKWPSRLSVKKYPNGKQSSYLHNLQPGDSVTFFRIPGYKYKVNEQKHIGLVAGGQGITPCYQLLRGILLNPADETRITLVWGTNTDEDVILRDELAQLQQTYPGRLSVKVVVSRPAAGSPYAQGRVTKELLAEAGVTGSGVGKVFMSGRPAWRRPLAAEAVFFHSWALARHRCTLFRVGGRDVFIWAGRGSRRRIKAYFLFQFRLSWIFRL